MIQALIIVSLAEIVLLNVVLFVVVRGLEKIHRKLNKLDYFGSVMINTSYGKFAARPFGPDRDAYGKPKADLRSVLMQEAADAARD